MLNTLSLAGLIPAIKVNNAGDAVPISKALMAGAAGGEFTFRSDAAEEAIRLVHQELPDILLGAGTVLTCDQPTAPSGPARAIS